MPSYELTCTADQDFETISEFGLDTFGVGHIHTGYRRSVYGAHAIYCRIESQGIVIVRLLGQQDIADAFS